METKAVIISGEAPESDEESIGVKTGIGFPLLLASNSCGTIIQGEARESDDENNSVSSASYAVDPSTCSYTEVRGNKSEKSCVKYNSLLHKKLRECNKSLDRNIRDLLTTTISNAMEELTDINKQLLKSELVLQETVSKFQASSNQFEETFNTLNQILEEDFLSTLKI